MSMVACLLALAGCGQAAPPHTAPEPATEARAYDPAAAFVDRPCSLLTPEDAVHITGKRYFDTLARNEVLGDGVRCAIGVGEGGLSATVELQVLHAIDQPATILAGLCAPGALQAPMAVPGCRTRTNAYAAIGADRVLIAKVSGVTGRADQARSLRLATKMAPRLASAQR
jgi:hypothetical protein